LRAALVAEKKIARAIVGAERKALKSAAPAANKSEKLKNDKDTTSKKSRKKELP